MSVQKAATAIALALLAGCGGTSQDFAGNTPAETVVASSQIDNRALAEKFRNAYRWDVTEENIGSAMTAMGNVVSGFTCSGVFVAGRDAKEFIAADTSVFASYDATAMDIDIDRDSKTVRVGLFGVDNVSTSVYREGVGCATVFDGYSAEDLKRTKIPERSIDVQSKAGLWPTGEQVDLTVKDAGVDQAALKAALDFAFAPATDPKNDPLTRAVVVVHKGKIIAEQYATGFGPHTLQYGASMSKSVTSALAGIRIHDGALSLHATGILPEWQKADDPRSKITLDHLLRMSSGLEYVSQYGWLQDGGRMLFQSPDMGGYTASKPLERPIDTHYKYTDGTTNIISKIIRNSFRGDEKTYLNYPRERLFNKIGMDTAVFQTDAAGTFVGSSYVWASARDFARLGLLYAQDGVWNGERLWNEGWVDYSTTPSSTLLEGDSLGRSYGAQIWIYPPFKKDVPAANYAFRGWGGQLVGIVPSKDLVVVRMGLTRPGSGSWNEGKFFELVRAAFPDSNAK